MFKEVPIWRIFKPHQELNRLTVTTLCYHCYAPCMAHAEIEHGFDEQVFPLCRPLSLDAFLVWTECYVSFGSVSTEK